MNESPCDTCHNYWLCMEGSRACSDFKLFYDTGKITHHDRSPNWYIDLPPHTPSQYESYQNGVGLAKKLTN